MTEASPDPIEARLKDALADRYAVEQKLGEGGMALVYLARDLKHDRLVALKILKPDLAASIGADRFLKEIRHTAKLSHPHILPLYDSGEADGLLYYVMPFVEGESLSDLMRREKQLAIHEAVRITREVAEALGYAHSYGLIHRDIKPDNVLLSGGHAIVADFGISKALSQAGGDQLTKTGTAVGTPAYMSPEQAMGNPDIDGRSDVYSLGCVLYQMLVGDVPFTGPTPQAVMARHTMDHITAPSIMRDTIPAELEEIVFTSMAKTPADRFRTAQEMAEALEAVQTGAAASRPSTVQRMSVAQRMSGMQQGPWTTPQTPVPTVAVTGPRPAWKRVAVPAGVALGIIALGFVGWQLLGKGGGSGASGSLKAGGLDPRRVAVLYFEDLTPDRELGYIADGLTEGLISELSTVRGLNVISGNGVALFRDADVSRDSIARVLEVGTVIVGSVERQRDQLRVTTQLVDGQSGAPFERASFVLPADALLAIMDSVTKDVSRLLRGRLGEEVRTRELRAGTASAEAWTLVQRGEQLRKEAQALWEASDSAASVAAYERADSILAFAETADPRWPEPIVLRAELTRQRTVMASTPEESDQWSAAGIAHAERALALDRDNPKALGLRGTLQYLSWFYGPEPEPAEADRLLASARADLEAAIASDPTLASAHEALSVVLYELGELVPANLAALRALDADAYLRNADRIMFRLFSTSYDIENFAEARRWCDEGGRRFPDDPRFVQCQLWMQTTRAATPDPDEAWRQFARLETLTPEPRWPYWKRRGQMLVAGSLARAGLADSARSLLVSSRGDPDVDPDRTLVTLEAFIRTLLSDTDEALRLLQSYMVFNPHHRHEQSETIHWWWRGLQDDPRYRAMMRSGG